MERREGLVMKRQVARRLLRLQVVASFRGWAWMDTCGVQQELQIKIGKSCKRKDVLVFNRQAGEKPEKIQHESVTY